MDDSSSSTTAPSPFCGDRNVDADEECDDGNDVGTDECTTACTMAICGDGFVWEGNEPCDDGNDVVTDDCTVDCATAFCGDGYIHVGTEDCDDVNEATGDGCAPGCVAESAFIYMMQLHDTSALHRYSVEGDSWDTIATGDESEAYPTLAADGEAVYWAYSGLLGRFDLTTLSVEYIDPPSSELTAGASGYTLELVAAEGRLYLLVLPWPETTMETNIFVYEEGEWSRFDIDVELRNGSAWDAAAHELYVGIAGDLGFAVIDTITNTVVREFPTGIESDWYTGAFVGGQFYSRAFDGSLQQLDAYDGTLVDTGVVPTSPYFNWAVANQATGKIYLTGNTSAVNDFEVYDTLDGSLSALAPLPVPINEHTNLAPAVLVYAPE